MKFEIALARVIICLIGFIPAFDLYYDWQLIVSPLPDFHVHLARTAILFIAWLVILWQHNAIEVIVARYMDGEGKEMLLDTLIKLLESNAMAEGSLPRGLNASGSRKPLPTKTGPLKRCLLKLIKKI